MKKFFVDKFFSTKIDRNDEQSRVAEGKETK